MIITKLRGGLGNQMFQYTYGKKLALETGQQLKFDLSWFDSPGAVSPQREYELGMFALEVPAASRAEIMLAKLLGRHVAGFWQKYEYVRTVERELRADFRFRTPVGDATRALLARIRSSNAVCVNVRRTDFIGRGDTLDIGYYERAVERMRDMVADPSFFVFSDDIAWCRANLGFIPGAKFVDDGPAVPLSDHFQAMAACRHFVIANSTFGWWAAFLGSTPDKHVIAPAQWVVDSARNTTVSRELIPPEWTVIQ